MNKKIKCTKCGSDNIITEPIKYSDGIISDDSECAECLDCGHEFIIAYI